MMDQPPEALTSQDRIVEQRLVACGLDATGISVKYQAYLQGIEVIIRPAAKADQSHFACINQAVEHEIVTFEDGAMNAAYVKYSADLAQPQILANLTAALQKRNLLQGFPRRQDFPSLAAYAKALEQHAGTKSGTALRVIGDSIVFDPPKNATLPAAFADKYSDLMCVVMFAAEQDHINFGFIGNEAAAPER